MADFRGFVHQAMESRGLSLRKLAKAVNYDPGYVSRVLGGKRRPSPGLARALDNFFESDGVLGSLAEAVSIEDQERVVGVLKEPARLDKHTVKILADVLAAQRRLDDVMPASVMIPAATAQWDSVKQLAREARGHSAEQFHFVAAEWVQFIGWLHAEAAHVPQAARWLNEAEEVADNLGSGVLAAQAANFKGYLARHLGRPRAVVRWFLAAHHTPGAAPLQRVGDAAQAAHGYAWLGETDSARRLLGAASDLLDGAKDTAPPETAYWLSPGFSRLNLGLAHLALGDGGDAAANLEAGLDSLPADQFNAEWANEYRDALRTARAA